MEINPLYAYGMVLRSMRRTFRRNINVLNFLFPSMVLIVLFYVWFCGSSLKGIFLGLTPMVWCDFSDSSASTILEIFFNAFIDFNS